MQLNTNVMQAPRVITDVTTLADRLKTERERLEMTQVDLARKSGVSQGTIGNLEAGLRKSARNLAQIAAALGVSALWLAEGRGPRLLGAGGDQVRMSLAESPGAPDPLVLQAIDDLKDLQRLDPEARARLLSDLHNAADRARAIARRATQPQKDQATSAAARASRARSSIALKLGDGNPDQGMLPLTTVPDPFNAEPTERELALYHRIAKDKERHPK